MACLAATGLVVSLAWTAFAEGRPSSDQAACFNNLRLVGRAVEMWAADHVDQPSWRTPTTLGGTKPVTGLKAGAAWFEFAAMSNELYTPRILACPADETVRVGAEFSTVPTRGYMATGMRGLATSYTVFLDNSYQVPASPVSSDRNIRTEGVTSCAQGVNNADYFMPFGSLALWTNQVHGLKGHLLLTDGGVVMTDSESARVLFQQAMQYGENSVPHFLRAR